MQPCSWSIGLRLKQHTTFNPSKLINDNQKIYFNIYHEDQNAIILIALASDTSGIAAMMLNKSDLTYGGSQIFHPFNNDENSDFTFGRCDKIN